MEKSRQRFVGKKDLVVTPLIQLSLLLSSIAISFLIDRSFYQLRILEFIVVTYVNLMILTLIILKLIRLLFPFKEGIFTESNQPNEIYIWNLYGFLCFMNLTLFFQSTLLPILFRKFALQLLGAKIANGVFAICGNVTDPHMLVMDENVILGDECQISSHAIITISTGDALVVKKIHLKKNCIIGARAMLLPGVVVGEGATVAPNIVVPMNTLIPANTHWPAHKI